MGAPSLISFHRMRATLTHPAEATAANGTNLASVPRVAGESERRRGTSELSPTATEHEAAVAET